MVCELYQPQTSAKHPRMTAALISGHQPRKKLWHSRDQQGSKGHQEPPPSSTTVQSLKSHIQIPSWKATRDSRNLKSWVLYLTEIRIYLRKIFFFIELNKICLVGLKLTLSHKLSYLGQRKMGEEALSWRWTNYRGKEPYFVVVVAHLREMGIILPFCCKADIEHLVSG